MTHPIKNVSVSTDMRVAEFGAVLHMPNALKGDGAHRLPPCNAQLAYPVDEYPSAPTNWMHGSDVASSYFIGIEAGKGMWIDLRPCERHTHYVAAVISIQGVNPITGPLTESGEAQVAELALHQYKQKCPNHGVDFQQDRFCPKCNFKWPKQNYLTTVTTPRGEFWLDGFRRPDGTVRQYIFTEEELRGVASQTIGDQRVFAIGIAFFKSRELKPAPVHQPFRTQDYKKYLMDLAPCNSAGGAQTFGTLGDSTGSTTYGCDTVKISASSAGSPVRTRSAVRGRAQTKSVFQESPEDADPRFAAGGGVAHAEDDVVEKVATKKIEIGAGAKINQRVHDDTEDLDFYDDKPSGFIYINYVTNAATQEIIRRGRRKHTEEGSMDGLKVGN